MEKILHACLYSFTTIEWPSIQITMWPCGFSFCSVIYITSFLFFFFSNYYITLLILSGCKVLVTIVTNMSIYLQYFLVLNTHFANQMWFCSLKSTYATIGYSNEYGRHKSWLTMALTNSGKGEWKYKDNGVIY
jgi:hypothetical protein